MVFEGGGGGSIAAKTLIGFPFRREDGNYSDKYDRRYKWIYKHCFACFVKKTHTPNVTKTELNCCREPIWLLMTVEF